MERRPAAQTPPFKGFTWFCKSDQSQETVSLLVLSGGLCNEVFGRGPVGQPKEVETMRCFRAPIDDRRSLSSRLGIAHASVLHRSSVSVFRRGAGIFTSSSRRLVRLFLLLFVLIAFSLTLQDLSPSLLIFHLPFQLYFHSEARPSVCYAQPTDWLFLVRVGSPLFKFPRATNDDASSASDSDYDGV